MRSKGIIIGAVAVFAVLLVLYFYLNQQKGPKHNWYQSFDKKSSEPYGTMVIKQMLEASHTGSKTAIEKEPLHKVLSGTKFTNTDYVLIGHSIYLDEQDVASLKKFLDDGNNVFIATLDPPESLLKSVYTNECEGGIGYDYDIDTTIHANFYHPGLKRKRDYAFTYRVGSKDFPYYWRTLGESALCDSTVGISSIGYQENNSVNFFRISYGPADGQVYMHTAPVMFTNYFMAKADNMEYASSVFAHLTGDNLIWDDVSKVPFSNLQNPYDSPLYYIMQQPALKYAWWMLLVGAILYVIFASKRTQRIIPVLEPKTNTSLEFLNVISSLHYQNPDHLDMARKKMKYFL
ncbi:MAG TPA: DUF4350 domain-containing protein, partial [Cyclobacteriaceae bacterium]